MVDEDHRTWERAHQEYAARQRMKVLPAAILFAVGLTVCMCGGLGLFTESTGRTTGTSDTVMVLLGAGTVLLLAGFGWLRFRWRRHSYRIAHRFSVVALLAVVLVLVLVTAIPFGLAAVLNNAGVRYVAGPLLVVLLPLVASTYLTLRTALNMTPAGVSIGGFNLPWQSIAQLVVSTGAEGAEAEIGARLRDGAQVPPAATPPPPGDPAAPPVRVAVPRSRLDVSALLEAVARFGPPGVPVVERTPAGERILSR